MTLGFLLLGLLFSLSCFFLGYTLAYEDWEEEVELRVEAELDVLLGEPFDQEAVA